jgi:hypothetical protein
MRQIEPTQRCARAIAGACHYIATAAHEHPGNAKRNHVVSLVNGSWLKVSVEARHADPRAPYIAINDADTPMTETMTRRAVSLVECLYADEIFGMLFLRPEPPSDGQLTHVETIGDVTITITAEVRIPEAVAKQAAA